MSNEESATELAAKALPGQSVGLREASPTSTSPIQTGTLAAGCGVVLFSLSFPATVWATQGVGPWTATGLRGLLAGVLALALLVGLRVPRPRRADLLGLVIVAGGCVIGFPLLTTLALQTSTTAHSAVVIGLLPLATAVFGALRAQRRLPRRFWAAAITGAVVVVAFALTQSHGALSVADGYLLVALILCALGYAEGGRLAAHLPGWHVIAWAVVLCLPVSLAVTIAAAGVEPIEFSATSVIGLTYIAGISQLGGFVVWYRGMGLIGVAKASQLQLAQPILTLVWSVVLMGEHLPASAIVTAVGVLACIVVTQRSTSVARADIGEAV